MGNPNYRPRKNAVATITMPKILSQPRNLGSYKGRGAVLKVALDTVGNSWPISKLWYQASFQDPVDLSGITKLIKGELETQFAALDITKNLTITAVHLTSDGIAIIFPSFEMRDSASRSFAKWTENSIPRSEIQNLDAIKPLEVESFVVSRIPPTALDSDFLHAIGEKDRLFREKQRGFNGDQKLFHKNKEALAESNKLLKAHYAQFAAKNPCNWVNCTQTPYTVLSIRRLGGTSWKITVDSMVAMEYLTDKSWVHFFGADTEVIRPWVNGTHTDDGAAARPKRSWLAVPEPDVWVSK